MTLEEQIDKIVNGYYSSVIKWRWDWRSTSANSHWHKHLNDAHRLIEEADLTECLTSPSEYIREYRKLYENEVHAFTRKV